MNLFFCKLHRVKKVIGGVLILLVLGVCQVVAWSATEGLASAEISVPKGTEKPLSAKEFIKSACKDFYEKFINFKAKSSVTLMKGDVEAGSFDMEIDFKEDSLGKFKLSEKGISIYETIYFAKEDKFFEKCESDDSWKPASSDEPSDPKVKARAVAAGGPLEYLYYYADKELKAEFVFSGQQEIGGSLCKKVRMVTEPQEAERSFDEPLKAFGLEDVDWKSFKFEGTYWIEEKTKRFVRITAIISFLGNGGKTKYIIKVNMDFSHYGEDFDIEVPEEVKDLLKQE